MEHSRTLLAVLSGWSDVLVSGDIIGGTLPKFVEKSTFFAFCVLGEKCESADFSSPTLLHL